MKERFLICTALLLALFGVPSGCMREEPEHFRKPDWWTTGEEDEGTGEYRLVWSDEFDDEPADGQPWAEPSDGWIFETGGTGWGNDEEQYYVDKSYGGKAVSKVRDGCLILTAYKLDRPLGGKKYISARMTTKRSWTYGKMEMRAKLPAGRGTWPAFWMLPAARTSDNLLDGEIDIMEAGDHYTDASFASTAQYTCHNPYTINTPSKRYDIYRPGQDQPNSAKVALEDPSGYHVWTVEVTDEAVVWYIDGTQVHKYSNIRHTTADNGYKYAAETATNWAGEEIYPKANYLKNYTFTENNYFAIFDIAVGSSFVGGENDPANVPAQEGFEAQFDIDWIKISKIK